MNKICKTIKEDYHINKASYKSVFIVLFFRVSKFFALHNNRLIQILGIPIRILYKLIIEFTMSVEIPDKLSVGERLRVYHGMGLVINDKTIIGNDVILRQNTTIGSKYNGGSCPVIGNNVVIGANVVIIGDIKIGNNCIIGAGSIVTKSFQANSIIVGNPAKILNKENNL